LALREGKRARTYAEERLHILLGKFRTTPLPLSAPPEEEELVLI
jgi:hypothetical protein